MAASGPFLWQRPAWPQLSFDAASLLHEVQAARLEQGKLLGRAEALGLAGLQEVTQNLWVQEAVSTAAIEGESLNLDTVRSFVRRRLGMTDSLPPDRHVEGLIDVMQDAVDRHHEVLDEARLCLWQSALFPGGSSGLRRIAVGRYRDHPDAMQIVSGRPGREVVHYTAPPSVQVKPEMDRFLTWFEASRPQPAADDASMSGGLFRAAIAHLWFETIHPFEDGNGRLGRAIVDRAIAQDLGATTRLFSLSRHLLENRAAYYDALNGAQRGSTDVTAWVRWFVQAFARSCVHSQEVLRQATDKAAFWSRAANHPLNERQRKVLACLLDAGDGGFTGGMTAEKYSKITGASKATATRDLAALLRLGLLSMQGAGKATRYAVQIEGWNRRA